MNKASGTGTGQARYDNFDFDPELCGNVRRITSLPNESIWPKWIEAADSRVREEESSEIVEDDFISKEVDYEFFQKYFHNFDPQLPLLDHIQKELEELKSAMGDRKIVVRWPVTMVLATKRWVGPGRTRRHCKSKKMPPLVFTQLEAHAYVFSIAE